MLKGYKLFCDTLYVCKKTLLLCATMTDFIYTIKKYKAAGYHSSLCLCPLT